MSKDNRIHVQANKVGLYGGFLRAEGEKFFISDISKLGSWMTPLTPGVEPKIIEKRSQRQLEREYARLAAEQAEKDAKLSAEEKAAKEAAEEKKMARLAKREADLLAKEAKAGIVPTSEDPEADLI